MKLNNCDICGTRNELKIVDTEGGIIRVCPSCRIDKLREEFLLIYSIILICISLFINL
jgi:ribosome-binding protein aMBF1 (putative translation factor)